MNDLPTIDPSLNAREGAIHFRGYLVWSGQWVLLGAAPGAFMGPPGTCFAH